MSIAEGFLSWAGKQESQAAGGGGLSMGQSERETRAGGRQSSRLVSMASIADINLQLSLAQAF